MIHHIYLGVSGYDLKNIAFFYLKIFFYLSNSVDPGKMQHFASFYLGLHCLQKYSFSGFPNAKQGLKQDNVSIEMTNIVMDVHGNCIPYHF